MPTRRIAIGVEYGGGAYSGWQVQRTAPSVQDRLQRALTSVANHPIELICAGRTDSGVHARAQVAHFDTTVCRSLRAWLLGTNTLLPADIALRWVWPVANHFHARYSALSRTYRYLIVNRNARPALAAGRALCVHRPLDVQSMRTAAQWLIGEHDFSAFRAAGCQARTPVREVLRIDVERHGDWITIDVSANAFLHHMVRNIVGLLLAVGRGDAPPERAHTQLLSRLRTAGEATAAAHGLYFWRAQYPPQFGLPEDSAMIAPLPSMRVMNDVLV